MEFSPFSFAQGLNWTDTNTQRHTNDDHIIIIHSYATQIGSFFDLSAAALFLTCIIITYCWQTHKKNVLNQCIQYMYRKNWGTHKHTTSVTVSEWLLLNENRSIGIPVIANDMRMRNFIDSLFLYWRTKYQKWPLYLTLLRISQGSITNQVQNILWFEWGRILVSFSIRMVFW